MDFRAYLTYHGAQGDFVILRIRFADPEHYDLADWVADMNGDDISALSWVAFTGIIPDEIPASTEIPNEAGGTYTTTQDLYFVAAHDQSHVLGIYPDEPIEAISISTTFINSPFLFYAPEPPYEGMDVPAEIDPDTFEPDENGYYLGDSWGWGLPEIAYTSDYYDWSWLEWKWSFIWEGCEEYFHLNHIMNFLDDLTLKLNGEYWDLESGHWINAACNPGDWVVVYETGVTWARQSVWVWMPDEDSPIIYFAPGLFEPAEPVPAPDITAILLAAGGLLLNLIGNPGSQMLRPFEFYAEPRKMPLGGSTEKPLGGSTDKPIGGRL